MIFHDIPQYTILFTKLSLAQNLEGNFLRAKSSTSDFHFLLASMFQPKKEKITTRWLGQLLSPWVFTHQNSASGATFADDKRQGYMVPLSMTMEIYHSMLKAHPWNLQQAREIGLDTNRNQKLLAWCSSFKCIKNHQTTDNNTINMQLPTVVSGSPFDTALLCDQPRNVHEMIELRFPLAAGVMLYYSSVPVKTTSPYGSSYDISVVPRQHMTDRWLPKCSHYCINPKQCQPITKHFCRYSYVYTWRYQNIAVYIITCIHACIHISIFILHVYIYIYM